MRTQTMTRKALAICTSAVFAFTSACGLFDSEPELSHAVATLVCGPVDQGFTGIVLAHDPIKSVAEPPLPHVRLMILAWVDELAARTWDITTDMGPGAWYVRGPDDSQPALSGRVRVTSVDSNRTVHGAVELRFPSRVVNTDFSAPWVESLVVCG